MNKKLLYVFSIFILFLMGISLVNAVNFCWGQPDYTDCGICCICLEGQDTYDGTQNIDCIDLSEIGTCTWEPDVNDLTWDYHAFVENVCVDIFICDNPKYDDYTHTCDMDECGAECESNEDCKPYMSEGEQPVFDGPKREGSVCYYDGYCEESCECDYDSTDWCPEPGFSEPTDDGQTCIYDIICTEEGCDYDEDDCPEFYMEENTCYYDAECDYWDGCDYDNDDECPEPGIHEGEIDICVYNVECIENGCNNSEDPMGEHNECDSVQGPVTSPPTSLIIDGYTSDWTNQTDWHIYLKIEDIGSWATNFYYGINGSEYDVPNSNSDNPFYYDTSFNLDEGEHLLEYYSVDYADNTEETNEAPIKIDLTSPEVNAGSDKTSTGNVDIDATASDSLSGIESYEWTQRSGPGTITFSNKHEEDTAAAASEVGEYELRLTVEDNAGNINHDGMIYIKEAKKSSGGGASSKGGPICGENWSCGSWNSCDITRTQTRTCIDLNDCGTFVDKPTEEQECIYNSPTPTPVIVEINETEEDNETGEGNNESSGNPITGAAVGPIQGNPLGGLFGSFWDWLMSFFS